MKYLNKITSDPYQQFTLTGIQGLSISMKLRYLPTQSLWMMDISDGTTTINGIIVVCHANLLRQWKNVIKFGMACMTTDGQDPFFLDDFSTQRVNLYLLDSSEVSTIETGLFTS